ncbi:uncharacterized protein LOC129724575 [Wyeomyia smithii]|uniref:uncharacterized protein LOC129724575 n=1 Tax=Wyeomyia smithii TaxID=174621 RepID=UPI002467CC97|nr:uncharacterized protein LOC129724575 [Wyeomyia smithii]
MILAAFHLLIFSAASTVAETDSIGCISASCDTFADVQTRWCHERPDRYCQCMQLKGSFWSQQVRLCDKGMLFSFSHQSCVSPAERAPLEICYLDTSESGSGSGDDSELPVSLCDGYPCDELFNHNFPAVVEDDLVEDDLMEFLFPRNRA